MVQTLVSTLQLAKIRGIIMKFLNQSVFSKVIMGLLAGSVLLGCTNEVNQPNQIAESTANSDKPMIQIPGKTGAPIYMEYRILTDAPESGQTVEIEVNVTSPLETTVSTEMTSAKKLTWLNAQKNWKNTLTKAGEKSALPTLKVIAESDGVYYIHFVATVEHNGESLAKPFTIPVSIGKGTVKLEKNGQVVTDEKGQKVIVNKAQSDN